MKISVCYPLAKLLLKLRSVYENKYAKKNMEILLAIAAFHFYVVLLILACISVPKKHALLIRRHVLELASYPSLSCDSHTHTVLCAPRNSPLKPLCTNKSLKRDILNMCPFYGFNSLWQSIKLNDSCSLNEFLRVEKCVGVIKGLVL